MNCVMFVDTPFVQTNRLFGEDCNLEMFVPRKDGVNPDINMDWCIGLRMPNPDLNDKWYDKVGAMIGVGAAINKFAMLGGRGISETSCILVIICTCFSNWFCNSYIQKESWEVSILSGDRMRLVWIMCCFVCVYCIQGNDE